MRFGTQAGQLALTACAIIGGATLHAQDRGWYVGANLGQSHANIDNPGIVRGLAGVGFATTAIRDGATDMGGKLFLGYELNRYFALEGGLNYLGQFRYTADVLPAGTMAGNAVLRGLNFDAVVKLPLGNRFSLFGRVGANYAQAQDTFTGTGKVVVMVPNPSQSGLDYKFGGGLEFKVNRRVALRLENERYHVADAIHNKGDLDLTSVGLVVRFGKAAPAPMAVAVSAPILVPPPPRVAAPVLVVVPVAAPTQEYCTILDLQFDIDRDDILREDKEKLAVVGTFLARYPATTAVIEGHSDNVGTDDHNMKLSLRRAQAVVDYLVTDLRIDRARLTAVGYGDSRPVADNATEDGKRRNRRIDAVIACVTDVEGLKVAPARMTMALLIDFDRNKEDIKPEYEEQILKVARFLKANPAVTATVEGHSSNLVSPERATVVSVLRAQRVVDFLVDKGGINRTRLAIRGYGDDRRFAYNTTQEGQSENRRVNIIINYPK